MPQSCGVRYGLAIGLLLLAQAVATPTRAQPSDYPSRKITFVVRLRAGRRHRYLCARDAQELTEQFGWQIVIENRAGAASNIAAKLVAAAAPTLHTAVHRNSYAINQTLYRNPGLRHRGPGPGRFRGARTARRSRSMRTIRRAPCRNFSRPRSPSRSISASVGHPRASRPNTFSMCWRRRTRRACRSRAALQRSTLCSAITSTSTSGPVAEVHPMIQQGTVRALAVTGPRRAEALPDVPTLDELGFPGLGINGWIGLLAPARTPPEIQARFNAAVNQIIATPKVEQRLRVLGYEPYRGSLARAPAFLSRQIETWGQLIRATGIAAEITPGFLNPSMRQRIRPQLEMHHHGFHPLAAFLQPRRPVGRCWSTIPGPSSRHWDHRCAVQPLGVEAGRILAPSCDHLAVLEGVRPSSGCRSDRHVRAEPKVLCWSTQE